MSIANRSSGAIIICTWAAHVGSIASRYCMKELSAWLGCVAEMSAMTPLGASTATLLRGASFRATAGAALAIRSSTAAGFGAHVQKGRS